MNRLKHQSENVSIPALHTVIMGWTLHRPRGWSIRFTDKVKKYLTAKFDLGEQSGLKADPQQVSNDMRKTRDEQKLEAETCLIRSYVESLLRAGSREVVLHAISLISVKLCQFKGSAPKLKNTNWFLFWFFPGEDRPRPVFLGFHQGNRLKISEMYEALTFDSL